MQLIPVRPLKGIWLKASVLGSIWASVEIILGSFLHNMRLPFSGMILSFIGVWLLISFFQFWKERGLIWRAGIICALMKSISPSAIIFGPMIGIFTEAVFIELFILVLGKNIIGYSAGGAMAVLSTLIQKFLNLLILYGFDFIKILADLYKYAVKQTSLDKLSPVWLLSVIIGIYIIAGVVAAAGGFITGSKYIKQKNTNTRSSEIVLNSKNTLFGQTAGQSYSVIFLLVNLISITAVLLLINSEMVILTYLGFSSYIIFCIYNYRNSLRRLKKVSFWISFLVITSAAAFLWSGFQEGAFFSPDGLIIGLKMNARAIIIIMGFAAISVELRNPVIKSLLYHRGFASLYQSMNLAFSALPFLISNPSGTPDKKLTSSISIRKLYGQAEVLLRLFETDHLKRPQVVIITGEVHEGKTTFTQQIVNELINEKVRVAGFLATAINENMERTGFNLYDIETKESIELCSGNKDKSRPRSGKYYFNPEAFSKGNKILSPENLSGKQLIVIDEIGPLELKGGGWSNAIDNISRNLTIPQLWVARKGIIIQITRRWNTGNVYIFDISESSVEEVKNKLLEVISQI
jgi:nucleoside-triphosphatase THEP1